MISAAEQDAGRSWRPSWLLRLLVGVKRYSLDSRLLAGESPAESAELAERYAQLLDQHYLRALSEGLEQVVDRAQAPAWLNRRSPRIPLRRGEVGENRSLLLALSRDLVEQSPPQPRGVILADRLLRDGCSPLYAGDLLFAQEERPSVEVAVRQARAALLMG